MEPDTRRRLVAGVLAVAFGVVSWPIADRLLQGALGIVGPPVLYGMLAVGVVGAGVAIRYSGARSMGDAVLYALLGVGSAFATFLFVFFQTGA